MDIYDINELESDSNQIFDLTKNTFQTKFENIRYIEYIVQQGEEMRIDLVCDSIYGNVDYIDILLNVNGIDNPLNIKEGSIIIYPEEQYITQLRIINVNSNVQSKITTEDRKSNSDSNRTSYTDQKYSLPPNVLSSPTEQVQINGNNISVGNGLFK